MRDTHPTLQKEGFCSWSTGNRVVDLEQFHPSGDIWQYQDILGITVARGIVLLTYSGWRLGITRPLLSLGNEKNSRLGTIHHILKFSEYLLSF